MTLIVVLVVVLSSTNTEVKVANLFPFAAIGVSKWVIVDLGEKNPRHCYLRSSLWLSILILSGDYSVLLALDSLVIDPIPTF